MEEIEKAGLLQEIGRLTAEQWGHIRDWLKTESETSKEMPAPSERFVCSVRDRWRVYDETTMECPQAPPLGPERAKFNPKTQAFELPPPPPRDTWVRVKLTHESFVLISKSQSDQDSMRSVAELLADAIRGRDLGASAPPTNIGERVVASSEICSVSYGGTIFLPNQSGVFLLPLSYTATVGTYQTSPSQHLGASGRTRIEFVEPEAKAA